MIWIADDFFGAGGADWPPPGAPPPGAPRARPAAAAVDQTAAPCWPPAGRIATMPCPGGMPRRGPPPPPPCWPPPPEGHTSSPPAWRRRGARPPAHTCLPSAARTPSARADPPSAPARTERGGRERRRRPARPMGGRAVGLRSGAAAHVLRGVHALALVHKHHIRVAGAHPALHHLLLVLRMHAVLLHPCARERPQRRAGSASAQILGASAERVRCGAASRRPANAAAARAWVCPCRQGARPAAEAVGCRSAAAGAAVRRRRGPTAAGRRIRGLRRCRGRRVVLFCIEVVVSSLRSLPRSSVVARRRARDELATAAAPAAPAAAAAAVSRDRDGAGSGPASSTPARQPRWRRSWELGGSRPLAAVRVPRKSRCGGQRAPHAAPASATAAAAAAAASPRAPPAGRAGACARGGRLGAGKASRALRLGVGSRGVRAVRPCASARPPRSSQAARKISLYERARALKRSAEQPPLTP